MNRTVTTVLTGLSLAASAPALAVPFNTFDPHSMARGGVGVAMPNPSNATLFNPAQLSALSEEDDFALGLSAGARAYDPDETVETLEDSSDTVDEIDALVEKIETGNYSLNTDGVDELEGDLEELARLTRELDDDFSDADGDVAQIEGGGALLLNRPSKTLGFGLTASAEAYAGGTLDYEDGDTLNALADEAENLAEGNITDPTSVELTSYEAGDLESEGAVLGAAIGQVGVTLSREFEFKGQPVAIGITPKSVQVETIHYRAEAEDFDDDEGGDDGLDDEDYRKSYSDTNLDIGLLTSFGNLSAGLTIKNLIAREYETAEVNGETEVIELDPQLRAGLGYEGGWYRLGADADVTTNAPVAFEEESRFVGIGGELDAWGWAQLRAGYRANLANSERNVTSVGLGLSPFQVLHLDVAVARNEHETGAALNLSLTF